MLRPGLKFLGSALVVLMASAAAAAQTPAPNAGPAGEQYIVVRRGEFLSQIARDYGIPIEFLIAANHLRPPYRLMIGQHLVVPASPPSQSPASAPAVPSPMPPTAAPVASASPRPPEAAPAIARPLQPMTIDPAPEQVLEPAHSSTLSESVPNETTADGSTPAIRQQPERDRDKGPALASPASGVGPVQIPTALLVAGELMTVAAALWLVTR